MQLETICWRVSDKAEGACRCRGEGPFTEILFSSKSVIKVLYGAAQNIFRHIVLHLGQETTSSTASMKKDR